MALAGIAPLTGPATTVAILAGASGITGGVRQVLSNDILGSKDFNLIYNAVLDGRAVERRNRETQITQQHRYENWTAAAILADIEPYHYDCGINFALHYLAQSAEGQAHITTTPTTDAAANAVAADAALKLQQVKKAAADALLATAADEVTQAKAALGAMAGPTTPALQANLDAANRQLQTQTAADTTAADALAKAQSAANDADAAARSLDIAKGAAASADQAKVTADAAVADAAAAKATVTLAPAVAAGKAPPPAGPPAAGATPLTAPIVTPAPHAVRVRGDAVKRVVLHDPLTPQAYLKAGILPPAAVNYRNSSDLSRTLIDMSSHNAGVPVTIALQDTFGVELIIHRATLGIGTPDKLFKTRLLEINNAGLIGGAYHVLYPNNSGRSQALEFLNVVKNSCVRGQRLVLAVDWEPVCVDKAKGKNACTKKTVPAATVNEFLTTVTSETQAIPLVYVGRKTIAANKEELASVSSKYPLWIATYYTKFWRPAAGEIDADKAIITNLSKNEKSLSLVSKIGYIIPLAADVQPWDDWTFWQFGDGKGPSVTAKSKPGVGNYSVDTSFFNGTRDEFHRFLQDYAWTCGPSKV